MMLSESCVAERVEHCENIDELGESIMILVAADAVIGGAENLRIEIAAYDNSCVLKI
jgi:hypothetical protein